MRGRLYLLLFYLCRRNAFRVGLINGVAIFAKLASFARFNGALIFGFGFDQRFAVGDRYLVIIRMYFNLLKKLGVKKKS